MLANFKLITVTHKNLDTEDLKHFVIPHTDEEELSRQLTSIKDNYDQSEVLYLSTCNRVVLFFYGESPISDSDASKLFVSLNPNLQSDIERNLGLIIQTFRGKTSIEHLMEVSSSLDSMVVGEREIFRQYRDSYELSARLGLTGDNLRLVDQAIVKATKDVYTNTEIGSKPVSVVSLAIQEFLKRGVSRDSRIILIGSGETNRAVGRHLFKKGFRNFSIFNRTLDNAQSFSKEIGADAYHLSELSDYKDGFDCLFACTSSQAPLVTKEFLHRNLGNCKPLIVDLAIPQNVSDDVKYSNLVDFINIESIRPLAEENVRYRNGSIASARVIIKRHLTAFDELLQRRKIERAFKKLPQEISKVKVRALEKVYKDKIESLPPEMKSLVIDIADYMEKKCVAIPMKLAKASLEEQ